MSALRILSVIHGPVFGGAHNQLLRLRAPLADRGFETVALLPSEAHTAATRLRESGVPEVVTAPLGRLRATPNPAIQARSVLGLVPDVRRLRRVIAERGIDVVQVHGATNPHGAIAARLQGQVAVVWQLFDTRAPMAARRLARPVVLRLADVVTAWGEALIVAHPGVERLGDRMITVFPPVDARQFAPDLERRARGRIALGVPDDAPLIGTVGVLNPQKGHQYLVRGAALLHRRHPDLFIRVLGASSPVHAGYERRIRAEASELGLARDGHLTFADPGTSVAELIQALDIFVMTSVPRSEGMPTVILEAMAAEKPVVATRVGAVEELVEHGVTGILVKPQDEKAMAAAIERLLSDDRLRAEMGAAGRRHALARFDLGRLADLHAKAYAMAVENRRRARPRG